MEHPGRILFDSHPAPIFVFEPDSLKLIDANPSARAFYGLGDLQNGSAARICPEFSRGEELAAGADSPPRPQTHLRGDGSMVTVSVRIVRVHWENRRALMAFMTSAAADLATADASDSPLRREQRLRVSAEQATREKDAFLALLAHELRNSYSAILNCSVMLRAAKNDPPTLERGLPVLDRATRSQGELIENLLEVSRILGGRLKLDTRTLDLGPVVRDAVDQIQLKAKDKSLRLEVQIDADVTVMGDGPRLRQIAQNLLSNAVRFTPREGWIRVRVDSVDGMARLVVGDSGAGIAPELLARLFDPARGMAPLTRDGGLGLGLVSVRHLVEMHGGAVTAESGGRGLGATFTVSLPLCQRRQSGASDGVLVLNDEPIDRTKLQGIRVLVVDDESDTLELLALTLNLHGATVRTASTVRAALDAFEREVPDVLISDLAMPGLNGYDLIRTVRLRGAESGGGVSALALTSFFKTEDKAKALAAGFNGHLGKPVEPSALADAVAKLKLQNVATNGWPG